MAITLTHQQRVLNAFTHQDQMLDKSSLIKLMKVTASQKPYYTGVINTMVRTGALLRDRKTSEYRLPAKPKAAVRVALAPAPAETAFRPSTVLARSQPETVEEYLRRGGKISKVKGIERYIPDLKRTTR